MKKRRIRKLIVVIIIVGVLIAGYFAYNSYMNKKETMEQFDVTVTTQKATFGDIGIYISASGTLSTKENTPVVSGTDGMVSAINVSVGDHVMTDDVLSSIDIESLQDEIALKEAEIISKQAQINTNTTLYEKDYIKSPVDGRIKEINVDYIDPEDVENDDDDVTWDDVVYQMVEDVMDEHGYLLSIALGDTMYVITDENTSQYSVGMELKTTIYDYDTTTYDVNVFVEKIVDDKVYISIPTNYRRADKEAIIYNLDGDEIGKGITQYYDEYFIKAERGKIVVTSVYSNELVNIGERLYTVIDDSPQVIRDLYTQLNVLEDELVELKEKAINPNIIAPCDGYIMVSNLLLGDETSAQDIAFEIANIEIWEASVSVDELDINDIEVGMSAKVQVDAIDDEEFIGKISKISSIGESQSGVTSYQVDIELPYYDGFRIEMNVSSEIMIKEVSSVVQIPIEAVTVMGDISFVNVYTQRSEQELEVIKQQILESQKQIENIATMTKEDYMAQMESKRGSAGKGDGSGQSGGKFISIDMDASKAIGISTQLGIAQQLYGTMVMVETGIQNETHIQIISGLDKDALVIIPEGEVNSIDPFGGGSIIPMGRIPNGK